MTDHEILTTLLHPGAMITEHGPGGWSQLLGRNGISRVHTAQVIDLIGKGWVKFDKRGIVRLTDEGLEEVLEEWEREVQRVW